MHILVLRSKLFLGLSLVERSAQGGSSSFPILKNVLVRAFDDKFFVAATNLEVAVQCTVPCKIITPGAFTVPFSVFYQIVKHVSGERITIAVQENVLSVVTDNYEASLHGSTADDFPVIPSIQSHESLLFKKGEFIQAVSRTLVPVKYSDIRPEIGGVYLRFAEGRVCFAGTDSFRLTECVLQPPSFESGCEALSCIIPLPAAQDALRIFAQTEEDTLRLTCSAGQVLIETESTRLVSRLVEGVFPDYAQIIPPRFACEALVLREELAASLKAVSAFSGKGNDVVLRVEPKGKCLEVSASLSALGENVYRLPVRLSGEGFSVVLNWRYLADGLRMYESKEVVIGVNAPDKPVGITSPSERDVRYVVMPIRG